MKIDSLWITAVLFFSLQAVLGDVYGLEIVAPDKFTKNAVIRLDGIEPYFGEDRLASLPWKVLFDGTPSDGKNWTNIQSFYYSSIFVYNGMLSTHYYTYRHNEIFGSGEFYAEVNNGPFEITLWHWTPLWTTKHQYGYRLAISDGKMSLFSLRGQKDIPLRFYDVPDTQSLSFNILAYRPVKNGPRVKYPMRVQIKVNEEVLCVFEDEFLPFGFVELERGEILKMRFRGTSSFDKSRHLLPEEVMRHFNSYLRPLDHTVSDGW